LNPYPENHAFYSLTETLLARKTAPLCPTAPHTKGLLAGVTGISYNQLAGLHLLNDDLDAAHRLVQTHEDDPTANYWHQLVHRREGDWGNSRYWIGKTGPHPFHEEFLVGSARDRVDRCERGARLHGDAEKEAAALSWAEIIGLLGWCVRNEK
jgi:hypothetical protein